MAAPSYSRPRFACCWSTLHSVMNNLAAAVATEPIPGKTVRGSRCAAASLRSAPRHPARVESRKPTTPTARVQKSERTSPREGHRIRLTMNRVIPTGAAATTHRKESQPMTTWNDITHFTGFDWAKDHHDVLVLDTSGKIVADFRFDHTAQAGSSFRKSWPSFRKWPLQSKPATVPQLND
jgi:hypothetical protein